MNEELKKDLEGEDVRDMVRTVLHCDHRFSVVVEWKDWGYHGTIGEDGRDIPGYVPGGRNATKLACEKCGEIKEL